jgi:dTDP-4-amino-4,6-dideoxygalactose transaminase
MINVTKTFLPPFEDYVRYLEQLWASGWITNNGVLVQELEAKLTEYLGVPYLQYVSNGTIALQIALKALNIMGQVITTPFSYVATTTAILWEKCQPIFVDIEDRTFCIDADKIEAAITPDTQAILAVHVYGYPCDVFKIQALAEKHGLRVIYDGAHAFGVRLNGSSLLNYGDLTTLSFHATKLFHTVEGGAVIAHTPEMAEQIWLRKSFGHCFDDYFIVGINGKNSEFHAAMGLCVLPHVAELIKRRHAISDLYDARLRGVGLRFPIKPEGLDYNYAYYPVLFQSEAQLLRVKASLAEEGVGTRRYFYPVLNKLPYHTGTDCPIAEDISRRVLCLPLYHDLGDDWVIRIAEVISNEI